MSVSLGRAVHRLDLRPWLVAAAGAAVFGAGVLAVELRGSGHSRAPGHFVPTGPAAEQNATRATAARSEPAAPRIAQTSVAPAAAKSADQPRVPSAAPIAGSAPIPKPSFDVVRISADGGAVFAGRAAPGADVVIRDDGQELGRVRADTTGQWVFLPPSRLAPGNRELTLTEHTAEGSELKADASVLLVVPDPKPDVAVNPTPPMAVLAPDKPGAEASLRLLQPPPPVGIGAEARLGLDVVQYDDHGAISFAGSAPPGAPLRVYVDNRRIGDAESDGTGRWLLRPASAVAFGRHQIRVDQLNPSGRVNARVELPFARQAEPQTPAANGAVVVQPGENLWRLARNVYGSGPRYTVIYQANRTEIRDPRLIYPGQIFTLPEPPRTAPAISDQPPPYSG